jgi:hypothetical protein
MTITISAAAPRGARAVAIAADAGQWLRCRTRNGRKAYGVPSQRKDHLYYLTTRTSCTCYDAQRGHVCKHQLAVQLHCELMAEQEAPEPKKPLTREAHPELARILGKRGVIPTSQIERED